MHPDVNYRSWMAKQAYKKAENDGDLEPWTEKQVNDFNEFQTFKPTTNRQLFECAAGRLCDLKNWVEQGNDSPYKTWKRVDNETEMRNLITGWLNKQSNNQYITAQEYELANSQRMDICLQNDNILSPIPIELKLLDKNWSGPKLCERLRNQLVGDYLREGDARYGIMLLVWKGSSNDKRWKINNRLVGLEKLAYELNEYWRNISDQFNAVESINVIVIDLCKRGKICDS